MKIERIVIRNFKSVKHIDIACYSKINAFIGENSVGKSNIFDAINWSLGPVYPSFNSTLSQDHFMGDPANEIKITLCFDDGKYLQLAENWVDQRQNQYPAVSCNPKRRQKDNISEEEKTHWTISFCKIHGQKNSHLWLRFRLQ
jgi:predicted ATP-dependent endonuclease of OLD family